MPDAFDGVMGKPDFPSHQPGAPLSSRFGLLFQSLCNHRFHLAVGDSSGRAAAGSVSQALDALSDITRSPFAHRWRADSQGGCHLPVIHTLRARQDDARTLSRPLASLRAPGDQFQLLSIFLPSILVSAWDVLLAFHPCYHLSTALKCLFNEVVLHDTMGLSLLKSLCSRRQACRRPSRKSRRFPKRF